MSSSAGGWSDSDADQSLGSSEDEWVDDGADRGGGDSEAGSEGQEELDAGDEEVSRSAAGEVAPPGTDALNDDFNRLLTTISQTDGDLHSAGALSQAHDASIAAEMAAIQDDIAMAKGSGRRRKRGPRERKLPQRIQELLGEGNAAYASLDNKGALAIMHEIIRVDATVHEAWVTLAQIHDELGNPVRALGLEIVAAQLKGDAATWKHLAYKSRQAGQLEQSKFCLKKALAMQPLDVEALWEQALTEKDAGEFTKALKDFKTLLSVIPHDLDVLAELPPLFAATNSVSLGLDIYRAAFEYYTTEMKQPADDAPSNRNWSLDHLTTLADLLLLTHDYEGVVEVIRRGQRWLQGRAAETDWDTLEDDREYDPEGSKRQIMQAGSSSGAGYELDINLRHRLAIARLRLGQDDEAFVHIDEVLRQDVVQFTALWADLGAVLIERRYYDKALAIFGELSEHEEVSEVSHVRHLAACHFELGNIEQAIEAYQFVYASDPSDNVSKLRLAEMWEAQGDNQRALGMVNEVLLDRQQDVSNEVSRVGPTVAETQARPENSVTRDRQTAQKSRAEARLALQRAAAQDLASLTEYEDRWRAGDEEVISQYCVVAERMVKRIQSARALFPVDRSRKSKPIEPKRRKVKRSGSPSLDVAARAGALAARLGAAAAGEEDVDDGSVQLVASMHEEPDHRFLGISAADWLHLTVVYCCFLMRYGPVDDAVLILIQFPHATIFQDDQAQLALSLTALAVSLRDDDHDSIVEQVRGLIRRHQFRLEAFQCLSAALGSGLKAAEAFTNLNLQKFLLRELKVWNASASSDDLRWTSRGRRWILPRPNAAAPEDDGSVAPIPTPGKISPIPHALYGEVLLTAKSYQSSIYYFLRAYANNPYDPVICLLLAQAYCGRAMNRQSDNRHLHVVTALAFLRRYGKLCETDVRPEKVAEVQYNHGRLYHSLGILHLAIRHYTAACETARSRLRLSRNRVGCGLLVSTARHAQHNMQLLLQTTQRC